jgi:signal peptide peptidase SppA
MMNMIPETIMTQPLLICAMALPAFMQRFAAMRTRAEAVLSMTQEQRFELSTFVNQRKPMSIVNGVAMIHVNDVLAQGTTPIDRMLGMTDYDELRSELNQAASNPAVKAVVLGISSPGGSAIGAPETAQAVADTVKIKPVISHISDIGASAAYYVASASSAIIAQSSGMVGSIGTKIQFLDFAKMAESQGITPHIITPKAADLKATGNSMRAPTEAELAYLQEHVEAINSEFTGWVQKHRPNVTGEQMRGQVFTGTQAAQNGLADYTGTMQDAIAAARALAGI